MTTQKATKKEFMYFLNTAASVDIEHFMDEFSETEWLWFSEWQKTQYYTVGFNPATMTRATQEDINRIWAQLWGGCTTPNCGWNFERENGELLDLTQTRSNSASGADSK